MTTTTTEGTVVSNSPVYDEAMRLSGLVGSNFKTLRDNKRKLAHSLVCSSVVEGFALSEAIKAAKGRMKWTKLDKPEQNQMNVLFNAVRTIDGAWKALPEDVRKAFVDGEIVFSTLAKQIKDAEKQELEADAEADAEAAPSEAATTEAAETDAIVAALDARVDADMAAINAVFSLQSYLDNRGEIPATVQEKLAELVGQIVALSAPKVEAKAA